MVCRSRRGAAARRRPARRLAHGLVLDTSKHLNRVLEINPDERWARVEPGVVLDDLNAGAAAARPSLRARRVVGQPRHRRRHDGQQLERRALGVVRQDHRSRARASTSCSSDGGVAHFRPLTRGSSFPPPARATASRRARYRPVPELARRHAAEIDRRLPEDPAARRRLQPRRLRRPLQAGRSHADPDRLRGHARILRRSRDGAGAAAEASRRVLTVEFDELLDALAATPLVLQARARRRSRSWTTSS